MYRKACNPGKTIDQSINLKSEYRSVLSVFRLIGFCLLILQLVFISSLKANQDILELKKLSLEELVDLEITSVSKKSEKLSEAAAAIFVITAEDIRRSGYTSIPEALRLVPGLQVARIDASEWAVSARGFNGTFANKLLVLIDGRSVYTPLFSGVYWDIQDVLLEDIARIEVIRGPGATLWGANAVNGVINIITKKASDTQGALLIAGIGTEEKGFTSFRYGGKITDSSFYRVYGKYFNRDDFAYSNDQNISDKWKSGRFGFRLDLDLSEKNKVNLQGDYYTGDIMQIFTFDFLEPPWDTTFVDKTKVRGGNIISKWTHKFNDISELSLKFYYDHTSRVDRFVNDCRHTYDLDLQHSHSFNNGLEIIWGLGYRLINENVDSSSQAWIGMDKNQTDVLSAFVQTGFSLYNNKVRFTLGSKFEHNDYTGNEIQPNARLSILPNQNHTIWFAAARAVRTPSYAEHFGRVYTRTIQPGTIENPSPLPIAAILYGNPDFESEILLAYEAGYRIQPTDKIAIDLAAFYNKYDQLITFNSDSLIPNSIPPTYVIQPVIVRNYLKADTYGLETALDWQLTDFLSMKAAYTYLQMILDYDEETHGPRLTPNEKTSPHNQLVLRSLLDLPCDIEFDATFRFMDKIELIDIDNYSTLDLRVGWKPWRNLQISVTGQNLLEKQHVEFKSLTNDVITKIERGFYTSLVWSF